MLDYLATAGKLPPKTEEERVTNVDVQKDEEGPLAGKQFKEGRKTENVSLTAALGLLQNPLKLPTFSGDPTSKADVAFDIWRYEVDGLLQDGLHSEEALRQAVRRSLKGEAKRIVMRLDLTATAHDIVGQLDGVYGTIEPGEALLGEFYSAHQLEDEDDLF